MEVEEDEEQEQQYQHIPEENYQNMTTGLFINFVQNYRLFLLDYINNRYHDDPDEIGYLTSFIDVCQGIDIDTGENVNYDDYRATIQPLMEWVTLWAEDMNEFYVNNYQDREQPALAEEMVLESIADRTRSKRHATSFEIPIAKRGRNAMTLQPTQQNAVRIKLSDGKEYTYGEIKHMWEWNKTITPYRHPYTEEDKQKIIDLIDFATKGGKKTRKVKKINKSNKTKRPRKSKRLRKSKKTKKTQKKKR